MVACGGGLRPGRGVLGSMRYPMEHRQTEGGKKREKELWRESKRASKGVRGDSPEQGGGT